MDRIARNLRVLIRARAILAEASLRHLLARNGLKLFAGLIATFGLLMLNVAGYFGLEPSFGRVLAAVTVALGDFLVALILIWLAARLPPGRDVRLAQELHGAALDALFADARMFEGFLKHPLEALLPSLVAPLANLLLAAVKKTAQPET